MTYGEMWVILQQVCAGEHNARFSQEEQDNYSFGDKLVEPDASLSLRGAGLHFLICCMGAGLLEEIHTLDGIRIKLHSSCGNRVRITSQIMFAKH